jgi:hypothetical protein
VRLLQTKGGEGLMKMTWVDSTNEKSEHLRQKYPHGYWYVCTDDGNYDADGPDPIGALAAFAAGLEEAVREEPRLP